jgi:hypothetical protein
MSRSAKPHYRNRVDASVSGGERETPAADEQRASRGAVGSRPLRWQHDGAATLVTRARVVPALVAGRTAGQREVGRVLLRANGSGRWDVARPGRRELTTAENRGVPGSSPGLAIAGKTCKTVTFVARLGHENERLRATDARKVPNGVPMAHGPWDRTGPATARLESGSRRSRLDQPIRWPRAWRVRTSPVRWCRLV